MKYIRIVADTNDADYIESIKLIEEEQIEKIMPLINGIKNFKPYLGTSTGSSNIIHRHNYPTYDIRKDLGEKYPHEIYEDVCNQEIINVFDNFVPYGEYGIHTIKSIDIFNVESVEKLL